MKNKDGVELFGLSVVLVRPRFPENVGSVGRACLNMGASDIRLVAPENWDVEKAAVLATQHARHLLEGATIHADLAGALLGVQEAFATTARLGGWRKALLSPDKAAGMAARRIAKGGTAALVMGPEDQGLGNDDLALCTRLVTIPTASEGRSLNLSQAALLLLWECLKARRTIAAGQDAGADVGADAGAAPGHGIGVPERELLMARVKKALLALDVLHGDNPDYFLMPFRRFLARTDISRREFDMLMGLCRQVEWLAEKAGRAG